MNENICKWDFWGFVATIVIGSAAHFLYGWLGQKTVIGLVCPVNESVWEHLKLLYFPCLAFSAIEYIYIGHHFENFIWARSCGLIFGLLTMIIAYYTYTGIIGRGFLLADIGLFILTAVICYAISWQLTCRFPAPSKYETAAWIAMAMLVGAMLVVFTFKPPHIDLFKDTQKNTYGITQNINKKK